MATPARAKETRESVILVGNPNVGKSVLFGHLTGRYVTVSNYPGTTVEVTRGSMRGGDGSLPVIDTPGINTLIPQSEDEKVTRDILMEEGGRGSVRIVQVGDAKNLPRVLLLSLQLREIGVPFVLCLNMLDEADTRGIRIDAGKLSSLLGVPVVETIATRRRGLDRLAGEIGRLGDGATAPPALEYDEHIEREIAAIEPLLPESGISRRATALMILAGDETLSEWLVERVGPHALSSIEGSCRRLREHNERSVAFVINQQRARAAADLAGSVTSSRGVDGRGGWAGRLLETIGAASMHPVVGMGVLAAVLYVLYLFVGVFGAGTAVDWLESGVFGTKIASLEMTLGPDGAPRVESGPETGEGRLVLLDSRRGPDGRLTIEVAAGEPGPQQGGAPVPRFYTLPPSGSFAPVTRTGEGAFTTTYTPGSTAPARIEVHQWSGAINARIHAFFMRFVPWEIARDAFVGSYGIVTMGLTYAIAIVFPIVATFFFAFSILEDSGYLPRLAIMLNRVFRLMGLNGKAVLPMVLGLGCDTMATLTTRILETKKERTIVILLLALGVPCSAQLGVILGMLASLSIAATLIWAGAVGGVIVLVGFLASRILPGAGSDFIMEIPPIRIPSLGNIAAKTLARIEWYLKEAVPLFVIGTIVLFVADRTRLLDALERAFSPLVTGALGLPRQATEAFIIGFLRRDFGSAGLYRLADAGLMDPVQIVVSLVTVTLFIPCIANFFMIVKEKGMTVALLVAAFIFPFALVVGAGLNVALRAAGGIP